MSVPKSPQQSVLHDFSRPEFPYTHLAGQPGRGFFGPLFPTTQDLARNNALLDAPSVLLQAVIVPGERTTEGQLIESVADAWFEIVQLLLRSPSEVQAIDWRKWEEIVAGAYRQQGFNVVLTPRSNDKGRDVIATRKDIGSVRFLDQVKAYSPEHVVTAEEVRAMVGVLTIEPNTSKGLVTTTSSFAPGIFTDPDIARLMPNRLELKAHNELLQWLKEIAAKRNG